MSTNRSHLTKTPIVDKNGVVTTRHTKADTSPARKSVRIPPVTSPVASSTPTEDMDRLHHLVYGEWEGGAQYREMLNWLHRDDPEVVKFALNLFDSGCETAQQQVSRSIKQKLKNRLLLHKDQRADWEPPKNTDEAIALKHSMIAAWHAGEIAEEAGLEMNPMDIASRTFQSDMMLRGLDQGREDRSLDDTYWRGLTIISASRSWMNPDARRDAPEFIAWSAKQPNAGLIIKIAKDHDTINVDLVKSLLVTHSETIPGLREGIL